MRRFKEITIQGQKLVIWNVPFVDLGKLVFDWRTYGVRTQHLVSAVLGRTYTPKELWNITLSLDPDTNKNVAIHLFKPILRQLSFTDKEIKYFNGLFNDRMVIVYQKHNKRRSWRDMTNEEIIEIFEKYKNEDKIVICWRRREITIYTHKGYIRTNRKNVRVARLIEQVVPSNIYCIAYDKNKLIQHLEQDEKITENWVKVLNFLKFEISR